MHFMKLKIPEKEKLSFHTADKGRGAEETKQILMDRLLSLFLQDVRNDNETKKLQ